MGGVGVLAKYCTIYVPAYSIHCVILFESTRTTQVGRRSRAARAARSAFVKVWWRRKCLLLPQSLLEAGTHLADDCLFIPILCKAYGRD